MPPKPKANLQQKILQTHFRLKRYRSEGERSFREDLNGDFWRGECLICASQGTEYTCVLTKENNPVTFGQNATTAWLHLDKHHGVNKEHSEYVRPLQSVSRADMIRFARGWCRRGYGYSIFRDTDITNMLRFNITDKTARELVVTAADVSRSLMYFTLSRLGGEVSVVCDLGTIHHITTLNMIAVHVKSKTSWLICSKVTPNSSAESLSALIKEGIREFRHYTDRAVQIAGIVTDNAPNIMKACEIVRRSNSAYLKRMLYFNCSCHVINLIAQDVDVEMTERYGMGGLDKQLLDSAIINRIVPTRWWSKVNEYSSIVKSSKRRSKVLAKPDGGAKLMFIENYVRSYRLLHVACRTLEGDNANVPMSVFIMHKIMDRVHDVTFMPTLNRYLKWYAASEVPLIFAVLCGETTPHFNLQVTDALYKAIFHVIVPHTDAQGVKVQKWLMGKHQAFNQTAPTEFMMHWIENGEHSWAREIAEKMCSVVASEASSERSLSRQASIRGERHSLRPERCELELILAFNPLEHLDEYLAQQAIMENVCTGAVSPQPTQNSLPVPSPFSLNEEATIKNLNAIRRVRNFELEGASDEEGVHVQPVQLFRTLSPMIPRTDEHVGEAEEQYLTDMKQLQSLTPSNCPALSAKFGVRTVLLWWWRQSQWEEFKSGMKVKFLNDNNLSTFTNAMIDSVNKKSFTVTISTRSGLQKITFDIGGAFIHQLQHHTQSFSWPIQELQFFPELSLCREVTGSSDAVEAKRRLGIIDQDNGFKDVVDFAQESPDDDFLLPVRITHAQEDEAVEIEGCGTESEEDE